MGTTYEHFVDTNKMCAAQEQFRDITKMVCDFVGLNKIDHFAVIKSAPLGRVDRKIALLRYVERLPLPDIAAQTHYSRTAVSYRLKGIEKMLDV